MSRTLHYYKPTELSAALRLLQQPALRVVPLAGGSWLAPRLRRDISSPLADAVDAVVDLADLGLNYVTVSEEAGQHWLHLGATTPLSSLVDDATCQELAGGVLAQAARADAPINVRNTATLGGCVARGDTSSLVLLALLALAAQVIIDDGQPRQLPLDTVLHDTAQAIGRGLIIEIRLPWPPSNTGSGLARVGRTPSDEPIVAAVAVSTGVAGRLALGGVANRPVLLSGINLENLGTVLADLLPSLDTPDDFRGSAAYRRAMAQVTAQRALIQAGGNALLA